MDLDDETKVGFSSPDVAPPVRRRFRHPPPNRDAGHCSCDDVLHAVPAVSVGLRVR
jgi:hypothetical protein